MAENKCPVCGNKDSFYIEATGTEWTGLISCGIGRVDLIACSECGCVYASERDRKQYKKLKEARKSNG